ncbi:MAG: amino acid transport protein [Candidatus Omnitrophota bacterium]
MSPAISNGVNTAHILASVFFGGIGFGAFIYGKKQSNLKALLIGVILMAYPYFVQNPIALFAIGFVLTMALFVPFGG